MAAEPAHAPQDPPYPGAALLGAAVATFFFPVISLIAALFLLSAERGPSRRASLRTWAWTSVAWILVQVLAFVLLLAAWSSGGGSEIGPITP
jgi:hypothetical protein